MPSSPEKRSHRDSWPPTQIYLKPTIVSTKATPLPELDDIDSDPLTYFLTPTPGFEDDDVDDAAMLDFDAGIEGASQPKDIARSVSPSTLDGLRKPGLPRPTSPDTCSDATMSDCDVGGAATDYDYDGFGYGYGYDDDDEDYIRFSPGRDGLLGLRDDTFLSAAAAGAEHLRPRSPASGFSRSPTRPTALGTAGAAALLLAPGSPQLRGRTRGRGHGGAVVGSSRSVSARRRPGQLWREPSPDVWSIEEETEEQLVRSGAGSPLGSSSGGGGGGGTGKPKKRVRFVLPTRVR